jgi:hypothetical protein
MTSEGARETGTRLVCLATALLATALLAAALTAMIVAGTVIPTGTAADAGPVATDKMVTFDQPVTFDQSAISVTLGDRFTLTSRVPDQVRSTHLIAHLNVVSLTPDVYVDPEDWSSERTQPVPRTTPARLTWPVQAVNAGVFDIYLVLVPTSPPSGGEPLKVSEPLQVSEPVRVVVANRQTINAGGTLPVIVAVPILIAVFFSILRWRRYRAVRTSPSVISR